MKLYFFMALEGSICILLYLLLKWFCPYEWSLRQRQFFLRMNMLLYLIPIPWLAYQGRKLWVGIKIRTGISKHDDVQAIVTQPNTLKESINVTTGKFLREITVHRSILVGAVVVMMVMLILIALYFLYYRNMALLRLSLLIQVM